MRKLVLSVTGNINFNPLILVDNRKVKFKKNKSNEIIYETETNKDELKIEIFKWFETEDKHWMLWSIIFFIISFFGVFDIKDDAKPYSLKYKGNIKLKEEENFLKITLNSFKPNELAFVFDGNCFLESNGTNKYFIDENVINKRKKIKKIKKTIGFCFIMFIVIVGILFLI